LANGSDVPFWPWMVDIELNVEITDGSYLFAYIPLILKKLDGGVCVGTNDICVFLLSILF
jgi:hypothetical protein